MGLFNHSSVFGFVFPLPGLLQTDIQLLFFEILANACFCHVPFIPCLRKNSVYCVWIFSVIGFLYHLLQLMAALSVLWK